MNENDISKSQNKKNVLHVIIEKRSSFKNFNKNKNVFTLNEFVLTKKEKKGFVLGVGGSPPQKKKGVWGRFPPVIFSEEV